MPPVPFASSTADSAGTIKTRAVSTATAAASPKTTTITLTRSGVYLVTASVKFEGSTDHMMTSTWLVSYLDSATNDILASSQLGATAKSAGSSLNLTDLTVSAPTSAGVVTVTASWAQAYNPTFTWAIETRLLMRLG